MKTTTHENLPTTDASKDPVVQKAIEMIKRTLFGASKKDLASRYLVAAKVEEIRTAAPNEKYRCRAVATIARGVGLTASRLYQYADVARAWNQGQFDDAGPRAAKAGLMFSHFVELAHKDHDAHRDQLLEEAIDKGLSVRKIRDMRSEAEKKSTAAATKGKPEYADILSRLAAEGPTDEIRQAIDAELGELHKRDAELQRRIEKLEAARATWATPAESASDLGKAAE